MEQRDGKKVTIKGVTTFTEAPAPSGSESGSRSQKIVFLNALFPNYLTAARLRLLCVSLAGAQYSSSGHFNRGFTPKRRYRQAPLIYITPCVFINNSSSGLF